MAGDKKRTKEIVTREYTVNLHKALHGVTFKKKAPRAIKAVRALPWPLPGARRGRRRASCYGPPRVCLHAAGAQRLPPAASASRDALKPCCLTPLAPGDAQVKDFAKKAMKTSEVRVDVKLNKFLWSKGIRNVRARRLSGLLLQPGRRRTG